MAYPDNKGISMSRSLHLLKTVSISLFAMVLAYGINFVITPFITERIGIEAYGFVSLAKTAVSYAGIITVALTSFIVRYISVSCLKGNSEESQSYYSSSIAASLVLCGAIFIVALVTITQLDKLLNISDELVVPVKILFGLSFFNFILTTLATSLGSSAYIKDRLDISGIIKIFAYVVEAGVLVALFVIFPPSVWYVGVGSVAASAVVLLLSWLMTRRLTPFLRFKRHLVSLEKIKDMVGNGFWNSLNQLGNVLNSGLDLIVANLMLSAVEMGQIAVTQTIWSIFAGLIQTVSQPFQPRLLKIYSSGDMDALACEIRKAMKFCGYFSGILFAGFLALGTLYYELWLPGQDTELLYHLTLVVVAISVTSGIMQPVYYVYTLTVSNRVPCWITIAAGILNIVSMYLLLTYTDVGVYGVVGTTTVIMVSINLLFNPLYAAKVGGFSAKSLYVGIVRHLLSVGCMVIVFMTIVDMLNPQGWLGLIGSVIPLCVVGLIVHFVAVASKDDWKTIGRVLRRRKLG